MRIVLDTNQLVRALMRPANLATFIMAWQSGRFNVIASNELLAEYKYVLAEPEIAVLLSPESVRVFHNHLLYGIERIYLPNIAPICRDPDDDKVIATAMYGRVDFLVSEDKDLLTRKVLTALKPYGITTISSDNLLRLLDTLPRN